MPEDPDPPKSPDEADAAGSSSGSIDVAMSGPISPPAAPSDDEQVDAPAEPADSDASAAMTTIERAPSASESGSIDVALSDPKMTLPATENERTAATATAISPAEAKPLPHTPRRRLTEGMKDVVGEGVTRLGTGIEHLGEGVSKLGEKSKKVPLVGQSVSMLGESLTSVGESLTELPRVAKTRRGRLLVRSMVVAFILVFAWIAVIVMLQVRGTDVPDFRPDAHRILLELSNGSAAIEQVYEQSSPRFQEMVGKERFIDDMTDLAATVGKYIEIAAVNDTLVTKGPAGRVGRVSLTVRFEKGKSKASVSLHLHEGAWKLLGIGVELPPEVTISQAQREERVQACKDPMDPKKCDLLVAANTILEQLRDGQAGQVWDAATSVFQKQEEKSRFIALQEINDRTLGAYKRIILVTEAKVIGGTHATFDVVTEYERSNGVRAIFGFYRRTKSDPWKLRSLKIVLPMPRAEEGSAVDSNVAGPAPARGSGGEDDAGRSPSTTAPKSPPPPKPVKPAPAGSAATSKPPNGSPAGSAATSKPPNGSPAGAVTPKPGAASGSASPPPSKPSSGSAMSPPSKPSAGSAAPSKSAAGPAAKSPPDASLSIGVSTGAGSSASSPKPSTP